MAKRVPPGEKPCRPLDDALVRAVLSPDAHGTPGAAPLMVKEVTASPGPVASSVATSPSDASSDAGAPILEKLSREKRLLLTPSEEREVERLVIDLALHLRTPLKTSHILRATMTLLRHAGEELLKQSQRIGPLKRPPNNDVLALATFEHFLARIIDVAVRNTRPLE